MENEHSQHPVALKERLLLSIMKGIARLPLRVLYIFADLIYFVVGYVIGYRKKVIRDNLVSAFPDKTEEEIRSITRKYYRFLADVIVETVKLFHISDREMARRVKVNEASLVNESLSEGRSAVIMLAHYGNWEWAQEISRHFIPSAYMASIYHPLTNPLWDDIFKKLRSRWNAHIIPQSKAVRTLLDKRNIPWACGFIADHRPYQKEEDNCLEFLNHKTYFIYGPEQIGNKVGADFFYLDMQRERRGFYTITFSRLRPLPGGKAYPHMREFWKELEATINHEPAYWLWSHKRWK